MAHITQRSIAVSEYILFRRDSGEGNLESTPMHVLKLAYLCHGWTLALTGKALIVELVEAWRYGPVIPSIYHCYKFYGADHINLKVEDNSPSFEGPEQEIMDDVLEIYRTESALGLSSITHLRGSPWDQIYHSKGEGAIT